jgi:hypothetical protein
VLVGTAPGITPFLFGFLARPMFNQVLWVVQMNCLWELDDVPLGRCISNLI